MRKTNEKGITLIALIITIIVMLILVGVTVAVVLNGGLFEKARFASERTKEEKEKELILEGYAYYNVRKYEKTEDLDELEKYFLGENKQGKDPFCEDENLVDWDRSTDDMVIIPFNGVDIIITEDNYSVSDDGVYDYYGFEYNNKYKLVYDRGNEIAKEIELQPPFEIQGADAIGDETNGWKITFLDTGNIYKINNKGKITSIMKLSADWWKLTEIEREELKDNYSNKQYNIAGDRVMVEEVVDGYYTIFIIDNKNNIYIYAADGRVDVGDDRILQNGKWYITTDGRTFRDIKEYVGSEPIQLDDLKMKK